MAAKLSLRSAAARAVAIFALAAVGCEDRLGAAESNVLPVPTITIYPGDAIKNNWLVEREFPENARSARAGVIETREAVVGKIARRTLLPGAPIPWNAIMEPKAVANGAKIRIVFEEAGLAITAYGAALQSGGVGDIVSVRNLDSGLTVSGTVQSDGSVRVSGG
jgi:flagella basal body P-ring formation protein FlgA